VNGSVSEGGTLTEPFPPAPIPLARSSWLGSSMVKRRQTSWPGGSVSADLPSPATSVTFGAPASSPAAAPGSEGRAGGASGPPVQDESLD
jgi:hypothetical protein